MNIHLMMIHIKEMVAKNNKMYSIAGSHSFWHKYFAQIQLSENFAT